MPKPTSFFIILILCIAGYYLLTNIHKFRYGFKRSNGYHTFLTSAGAGLIATAVAMIVYWIISWLFDAISFHFSLGDIVLSGLFNGSPTQADITTFDIGCLTLFLSLLAPTIYYGNQENQYEHFFVAFSSDCESPEYTQLFFRSYQYGLPILFTMSDRKVYIGYVAEIHAKEFNDVHVIPIFSGYRDKDSLKLIPVTPYSDILNDVKNVDVEEVDLEMFSVCLPIREIIHAHLHDFDYYEKFQEEEKKFETDTSLTKFTYNNINLK